MHHRRETTLIQPKHLRWRLDHHRKLIMILPAIDPGPVRGRTNLHHEDRSIRQRRNLHPPIVARPNAADRHISTGKAPDVVRSPADNDQSVIERDADSGAPPASRNRTSDRIYR